tara:strand:+ start:1501 stop:1656 length:156 start_codon:yes stop_codon:yes gene_type:complete
MRIFLEDYWGNDIARINIKGTCQITDLRDCSVADVDTDDIGEYTRIQLNNK